MSILRHLLAASAGAAIALSYIELGLAQDSSPLAHPQQNNSNNFPRHPSGQSLQLSPFSLPPLGQKTIPAPSRQLLAQSQPSAPPKSGSASEFLNPSANPLLFPTKPQEVKIQNLQQITLQQAWELAQRNNRDLQVSMHTLEGSRAALQEALASEYPTLIFQSDVTRAESASSKLSILRQSSASSAALLNDLQSPISTTFNGTLQLSYNLYTSGQREATIRAAERQVRFNELDFERQAAQIRLDVTNAYYDLQQANAQVQNAEAALLAAQRSLTDAQNQERVGLGTRFDVLRSQVQVANANQNRIKGISTQRIARRKLSQLLSVPQNVELAAVDIIEPAGRWNLSLEESIVLALKNRAEIEQQLVQREIYQQRQAAEVASGRPQVSLFLNYNVLDVFDDSIGATSGYSVGAQVQWTLYDGGAIRARAVQQQANIEAAETQFANFRNQVRFQVEQAYFNLKSNEENIKTAFLAYEQAEESLKLAELRFKAGVGTLTDVISTQADLAQARVNRYTAILDFNRALAALQRSISNLPDSKLSDVP
jgi:outer membrane protein TolC